MTPKRRFLIITADPGRARALEALAKDSGAKPSVAADEQGALAELGKGSHAAVFIDADNSAAPGVALCRRLRGLLPPSGCALILFGSPRGGETVVRGLDEGADDYWAYPLNAALCRAYLRAILRRVSRLGSSGETIKQDKLQLDPLRREASLDGKGLLLRSKEFDLLYLLVKERGKALSRDFLMEAAWGREYFGTTRTIDFHISRLRRKLGRLGARLQAVAGTGYKFTE